MSSKRNRNIPIQIYLNEDEKKILDYKTTIAHMRSQSAFIRHMIKYGFVYDVDYSPLQECNYQLAKIGNNINQIAHIANNNQSITELQIDEVKELMKRIWQLQQSILSRQPYTKQ